MNKIITFIIFLLIPVISVFIGAKNFSEKDIEINKIEEIKNSEIKNINIDEIKLSNDLEDINVSIENILYKLDEYNQMYDSLSNIVDESIKSSEEQRQLSDDVYEEMIERVLGKYIDFYLSDRCEIKIFELKELGYRGYIAKVKLFDPTAFKLVLAKDKLTYAETTSQAAKRKGAIFAVNGGGFGASVKNGEVRTGLIGGAIVDGVVKQEFKYVEGREFFFVGIDREGNLVGNVPKSQEDVDKLNAYQGTSFIPILIKDGKKLDIPGRWQKAKHPRTIIGQYANNDLILIAVDGRQGDYSVGITLERLQDKLIELGVKDAYNLDGGGSTAMYFKGKILNKPSDGKERPVGNNFIIMP